MYVLASVGGNKIEAHTIENEDSLSLDGVNGVVHKRNYHHLII